jgi:hypothetical protein
VGKGRIAFGINGLACGKVVEMGEWGGMGTRARRGHGIHWLILKDLGTSKVRIIGVLGFKSFIMIYI